MNIMAKKKSERAAEPYPSRKNTKYVGLPKALWDRLRTLAKEEERSVSWMVRKAVSEFLDKPKE